MSNEQMRQEKKNEERKMKKGRGLKALLIAHFSLLFFMVYMHYYETNNPGFRL
jgi:hypothetical protein